jgi:hypothetical protein
MAATMVGTEAADQLVGDYPAMVISDQLIEI